MISLFFFHRNTILPSHRTFMLLIIVLSFSLHRTAMQLALHGSAFSFHSLSKSLSFVSKALIHPK